MAELYSVIIDISRFAYLSVDGHSSCFHFWVIVDNAAVNICVQVFMWDVCFHFCWVYT